MITYSTECIRYYTSLYGPSRLQKDITIVSLPIDRKSTVAYYRSTLFVFVKWYLETEGISWQFNKTLFHELAHFFWAITNPLVRPPDSWVNEGLAEYSSWLAVQKILGDDYLNKCLEQATNTILKKPQVFLNHSVQDDYFYAFVPYIYHMLRYNLGDSLFFSMLKQFHPTIGTSGNLSAWAFIDTIQKFTSTPLNTFFEQWFSRDTLPNLAFTWQQDSLGVNNYRVLIEITQRQNQLFNIPVPIRLRFKSRESEVQKVVINDRRTSFSFQTQVKVDQLDLNADKNIVATIIRE
jgi:aminopeptidase N